MRKDLIDAYLHWCKTGPDDTRITTEEAIGINVTLTPEEDAYVLWWLEHRPDLRLSDGERVRLEEGSRRSLPRENLIDG